MLFSLYDCGKIVNRKIAHRTTENSALFCAALPTYGRKSVGDGNIFRKIAGIGLQPMGKTGIIGQSVQELRRRNGFEAGAG